MKKRMKEDKNNGIVCVLEFEYRTEAEARKVAEAIKVDDEGFVKTKVKGKKLMARIEARNAMSLLHTLDDYLVCLGVAERAVGGV